MADKISEAEFTIMSVIIYSYTFESIRSLYKHSDYDMISN
jgi:hypothetical protein